VVTTIARGIAEALAGVRGAVRARPLTFLAGALATGALSVLLPPLVLSLARKPVDYFTVNPWLRRLPDYLASEVPAGQKAARLWELALFWFSADSPYGGTEWGFAVDVGDVARITLTSLLFGAYFALWAARRRRSADDWGAPVGRPGGAVGAVASVVGLSTGPCSVMGCGAPVLPVVGLAFAGLSSGTLALLAGLSTAAATGVPLVMAAAVGYLGWRAGRPWRPRPPA
jgi:hypothetical protein